MGKGESLGKIVDMNSVDNNNVIQSRENNVISSV